MEIVIIILLILLNGIFAMSEIALISARRSNLELRARQGNAGARRALRIIEDPDKFLSTPAMRWLRNSAANSLCWVFPCARRRSRPK